MRIKRSISPIWSKRSAIIWTTIFRISPSLGYAIAPLDTWASLIHKIDNSMVIPSDYQTIFDNFNKHAELNKDAAQDFRGVFNDVNLGDWRLRLIHQ